MPLTNCADWAAPNLRARSMASSIATRGGVSPGQVTVRMASEARDYEYRVLIEWCAPCENGMFMSGGRFLRKTADATGA